MIFPSTSISRRLVGGIALALLLLAVVCAYLAGPRSVGAAATWGAASTRIGIVMGALWLALPTRDRAAAWANLDMRTVAAALLAALALPLLRIPFRFLLPLAAVLLAIGLWRRPKRPRRPRERSDRAGRR